MVVRKIASNAATQAQKNFAQNQASAATIPTHVSGGGGSISSEVKESLDQASTTMKSGTDPSTNRSHSIDAGRDANNPINYRRGQGPVNPNMRMSNSGDTSQLYTTGSGAENGGSFPFQGGRGTTASRDTPVSGAGERQSRFPMGNVPEGFNPPSGGTMGGAGNPNDRMGTTRLPPRQGAARRDGTEDYSFPQSRPNEGSNQASGNNMPEFPGSNGAVGGSTNTGSTASANTGSNNAGNGPDPTNPTNMDSGSGNGMYNWATERMGLSPTGAAAPEFAGKSVFGGAKEAFSWMNRGTGTDVAKKWGTYAGASIGARMATGGGVTYNSSGQSDIAGIPFI